MPMGVAMAPAFGQEWLQDNIILPLTEKFKAIGTVIAGMLDDITLGTRSASGKRPARGSAEETDMLDRHLLATRLLLERFKELGILFKFGSECLWHY